MTGEVGFHPAYTWRIKPETVMHKGGEYLKPCDDIGSETVVYYPDWKFSDNNNKVVSCSRSVVITENTRAIRALIKSGLAHKTREAAIAHAKVIYQIED